MPGGCGEGIKSVQKRNSRRCYGEEKSHMKVKRERFHIVRRLRRSLRGRGGLRTQTHRGATGASGKDNRKNTKDQVSSLPRGVREDKGRKKTGSGEVVIEGVKLRNGCVEWLIKY